jgi:CubicO group peptidase (beta-lactamase class C family)
MSELKERVEQAIAERVFPGCVVGVVRSGGSREVMPFGRFTYEQDSPEVREDTIYDMASVTKSIPVASLALMLMAEGKLRPAEKVVRYVPELQNDHGATIEDLLTYRVRGPRLSHLSYTTPEELQAYILERGFDGPPAESVYTNLPAFILGLVIERAGGSTLSELADRYFFGPLGMHDTTFFPSDASRIPPTEIVKGVEVRGIVHDESARVFSRARSSVGHAGLFSTAPDMLTFLEALLAGRFPAVADGAQKGWGWQQAEAWFMGSHFSKVAFGKTGFTGTSVALDPVKGVGFCILSNRTYPTRPPDAASLTSAINRFRADIADLLLH